MSLGETSGSDEGELELSEEAETESPEDSDAEGPRADPTAQRPNGGRLSRRSGRKTRWVSTHTLPPPPPSPPGGQGCPG